MVKEANENGKRYMYNNGLGNENSISTSRGLGW